MAVDSYPKGRFLFVKGKRENFQITLAAVYDPKTSQISFLRESLHRLRYFQEGELILAEISIILPILTWIICIRNVIVIIDPPSFQFHCHLCFLNLVFLIFGC